MKHFFKWLLASLRLNQKAICEMSHNGRDYHDYPDAEDPYPMHFHNYKCRHCGKEFYI